MWLIVVFALYTEYRCLHRNGGAWIENGGAYTYINMPSLRLVVDSTVLFQTSCQTIEVDTVSRWIRLMRKKPSRRPAFWLSNTFLFVQETDLCLGRRTTAWRVCSNDRFWINRTTRLHVQPCAVKRDGNMVNTWATCGDTSDGILAILFTHILQFHSIPQFHSMVPPYSSYPHNRERVPLNVNFLFWDNVETAKVFRHEQW
jgi:hypothetical protein